MFIFQRFFGVRSSTPTQSLEKVFVELRFSAHGDDNAWNDLDEDSEEMFKNSSVAMSKQIKGRFMKKMNVWYLFSQIFSLWPGKNS